MGLLQNLSSRPLLYEERFVDLVSLESPSQSTFFSQKEKSRHPTSTHILTYCMIIFPSLRRVKPLFQYGHKIFKLSIMSCNNVPIIDNVMCHRQTSRICYNTAGIAGAVLVWFCCTLAEKQWQYGTSVVRFRYPVHIPCISPWLSGDDVSANIYSSNSVQSHQGRTIYSTHKLFHQYGVVLLLTGAVHHFCSWSWLHSFTIHFSTLQR